MGHTKSVVGVQFGRELLLILDIHSIFKAVFLVSFSILEARVVSGIQVSGFKCVMDDVESQFEGVVVVEVIREILFDVHVTNHRLNGDAIFTHTKAKLVIVIAQNQGRIGEKALVKNVVPP